MVKQVVAVMGSYRKNGIIHQSVQCAEEELKKEGITFIRVDLLEKNIQFCTNCHVCNQKDPDKSRGVCPIRDDMNGILDMIDGSDGVILASPIDMFSTTAMMKRFTERMAVYGYWPRTEAHHTLFPSARVQAKRKKVIVIASWGKPGWLVPFFKGDVSNLITLANLSLYSKKTRLISIGGILLLKQDLSEKQKESVRKGVKNFF